MTKYLNTLINNIRNYNFKEIGDIVDNRDKFHDNQFKDQLFNLKQLCILCNGENFLMTE